MNTRTADATFRCGHPRTAENVRSESKGTGYARRDRCRECHNACKRLSYAANHPRVRKAAPEAPPSPRVQRVLDGSEPYDHRARLSPVGRRDLCSVCGFPVVELPPNGMLVHAGGPLARGRSDVMPRSRVSA